MTRIRQFANDMGITYNEAKGLINKGKKRRDGGSTVLESYMPIKIVAKEKEPKKRIFFKKGDPFKVSRKIVEDKKKNKVPMPKPRPKNLKKKDPFRADKTKSLNEKFSMETAKANEKAIKEIKKAMGGLERYEEGGVKKNKKRKSFTEKKRDERIQKQVEKLGGPKKTPKPKTLRQTAQKQLERARLIQQFPFSSTSKKEGTMMDLAGFKPATEKEAKTAYLKGTRGLYEENVPKELRDRIKFEKVQKKKDGGAFPDLSGDGKVTKKDILIGRGVIKKKMGGIARGGGAAIQGTGFKGVY